MKKLYRVSVVIKEIGTTNKIKLKGKKMSEKSTNTIKDTMFSKMIHDPVYQHYEDLKEAVNKLQTLKEE